MFFFISKSNVTFYPGFAYDHDIRCRALKLFRPGYKSVVRSSRFIARSLPVKNVLPDYVVHTKPMTV